MKKLLLASAIAALSVSAQAAPQVYGKAFLTVDYDDGSEKTTLNSNASRIGVKGSEALTANTDVVYQLEYRVEIDNNGTDDGTPKSSTELDKPKFRNFESRDTYLGLSNKQYGTVLAGRLTAIDDHVNYANVLAGGLYDAILGFDAPRADNAFAYVSPNYNGATFLGMYALDGGKDDDANDGLGNVEKFGVGAKYEPNGAPYRVGASFIKAGDRKVTRVSGDYDVNQALTVGVLVQNDNRGNGSKKENVLTVSGQYKTATPWTAYGQFDMQDNAGGVDGAETKRVVVGGKYAFNKATTGHVYAGVTDTKGSDEAFGIGGGLEYKF